jgi:hypothetical protein
MYSKQDVLFLMEKQRLQTLKNFREQSGYVGDLSSGLIDINSTTYSKKIKSVKTERKILSEVQLRIDNVTLTVSVDNKLKVRQDVLKNNGYIEITTGNINDENIFWDNLDWFIHVEYLDFISECEEDLKTLGYKNKQTFKIIQRLIRRAIKLGILIK